jgi:hypothetical protein
LILLGIHLKEVAYGEYHAQKLASIIVNVKQGDILILLLILLLKVKLKRVLFLYSHILAGVPLPNVLVSLNGESTILNEYTNNNGQFTFYDLLPGIIITT